MDKCIEIEIRDCSEHDEPSDDCDNCKKTILCPIKDYKECLDNLRNANDIVAPNRFVLKVEHRLEKPYLMEINRAKAMTRKEMLRTAGQTCENIYKHIQSNKHASHDIIYLNMIFHLGNNIYELDLHSLQ